MDTETTDMMWDKNKDEGRTWKIKYAAVLSSASLVLKFFLSLSFHYSTIFFLPRSLVQLVVLHGCPEIENGNLERHETEFILYFKMQLQGF